MWWLALTRFFPCNIGLPQIHPGFPMSRLVQKNPSNDFEIIFKPQSLEFAATQAVATAGTHCGCQDNVGRQSLSFDANGTSAHNRSLMSAVNSLQEIRAVHAS